MQNLFQTLQMSSENFCLRFSKMSTFIPNKTNEHQQPMMQNLKPHAQAHLLSPTEKCKVQIILYSLNILFRLLQDINYRLISDIIIDR